MLVIAGCATVVFSVAFVQRWFPLGLPGQWEWARYGVWDPPLTSWPAMIPSGLCALALAAWTRWALAHVETSGPRFLASALAGVIVFGGLFQMFLEVTAPTGLQKWASLYHGAHAAAHGDFNDVRSVLRGHAAAIADYEPNHCSANPAGWILVYRALLSFFDTHREAANLVWQAEPDEMAWALRNTIPGGTALPDQAAITTVAVANRLVALLVPLPLAWLVGQRHGRRAAVAAAAISMVVPVATLLAPWQDTVYATWATLIWALSCHASDRRSWAAAGTAGGLVGLGTMFSLSFVVVGSLAALFVAIRAVQGNRPSGWAVLAALAGWASTLGGFILAGHSPWETWTINLAKNHQFNLWSGCTYLPWTLINPLELGMAMGVPVSVYLLARVVSGLTSAMGKRRAAGARRSDALLVAWMAIIVMLDLAGTNRGEVCRLWYFLMPVGAALAIERLDLAGHRGRAVVAVLVLLQALECALVSREAVLVWTSMPHDTFETYLKPGNKTWSRFRRLSDEEFRRRQAAP
jgi:hypothetical protein